MCYYFSNLISHFFAAKMSVIKELTRNLHLTDLIILKI
jgi:hypothetical protein